MPSVLGCILASQAILRLRATRAGAASRGLNRSFACAILSSSEVGFMLRKFPAHVGLLAFTLVSFSALSLAQQSAAPEPYSVVHGWPQLPPGFVLGQVSGVAVDSHNHVFVFHRAENSWATDKTHPIASPTVLCFDGSSGRLLSSWGQNHFLEPHGLRVDSEDNVWVTDRALQQIFKFTHDGKLLMTIGTERVPCVDATHFNLPADIAFASDR